MKRLALALTFALALPATSIAKKPPQRLEDIESLAADGSATPGHATIYLMRGRSKAGVMMKHIVYIDGKRVGSMRRMNFLAVPLEAGTHTILIDCPSICSVPSINVTADFKADRTYYFINEPQMFSRTYSYDFTNNAWQLKREDAEAEMRDYIPGILDDKSGEPSP